MSAMSVYDAEAKAFIPERIVTPLTYSDALDLAALAMEGGNLLLMRHRIAKTLVEVSFAGIREGRADLLASMKSVLAALDNDCPLTAQQTAYAAITAVEPDFQPMTTTPAVGCGSDDYVDSPADGYAMKEGK